MIQQFRNDLIAAIKTAPIIYIPHFHFSFIDEILESILCPVGKKNFKFGTETILECSSNSRLCDFKSKKPDEAMVSLNTLLKEIVHPLAKPEEGEKDKRIVKEELHRLFILKNVHRDLGDKDTQILLQTFTEKYERGKYDDNTTIIIVANYPVSSLPTEISKLFTVINLPVPDAGDIEDELGLSDSIVNGSFNKNLSYEANGYVFGATFMYPEEKFINHRKELVGALLGMQIYDIRKVLKTIQKLEDCIDPRYEDVPLVEHILKEKRQLVNNSSMLEVIELSEDQKDRIGNIGNLKKFVEKQQRIIDNMAYYPSCLPKPKGILLVGPPGCGKSETVKSVAAIFKKPLLRLDIGRLMGQYVGQSEHNLIEAIRIAEAAQPCVLWIDEIEKAFAGFGNKGQDNDITVTRMVGYFLTWMQERKSLVYLVATANDLDSLRPELLRKGRWDEIFYLSYPDTNGAKEIVCKCLHKYGLYLTQGSKTVVNMSGGIDDSVLMDKLCKKMASSYFSGADIDSLIVQSFNEDWKLNDRRNINYATMERLVNTIADNKKKADEESRETEIKELILNFKINAGKKSLPNEGDLKELLSEKIKTKSPEELNSEYKSKGYISAS